MTPSYRVQRWSNTPAQHWETRAEHASEEDARAHFATAVRNEQGLIRLMRRTVRLVGPDGAVIAEWVPSQEAGDRG